MPASSSRPTATAPVHSRCCHAKRLHVVSIMFWDGARRVSRTAFSTVYITSLHITPGSTGSGSRKRVANGKLVQNAQIVPVAAHCAQLPSTAGKAIGQLFIIMQVVEERDSGCTH